MAQPKKLAPCSRVKELEGRYVPKMTTLLASPRAATDMATADIFKTLLQLATLRRAEVVQGEVV